MASVLVYLERSPKGLHPASALATCLARDIGTSRGASVLAVCLGDGGAFDDHVVAAAGKAGADQVVFVGPNGLRSMVDRLHPKHVFVPWTTAGNEAMHGAGLETEGTVWIGEPVTELKSLARVMGVVAGTLPWHQMPGLIEAEFDGEVDQASPPEWVSQATAPPVRDGSIYYVGPQDLAPEVKGALDGLGAQSVNPDYVNQHQSGTLLWLDAGPGGLPEPLRNRPPTARVIALPGGPLKEIHPSWTWADWVLPGPWEQALNELSGDAWKAALM